ncbi:MAG: response regulator transcription factor [Bacteroidia bacterium]|nr:response regulator transcription factor [Bacteroidia bacterium]
MQEIKIGILDDHPIVSKGLADYLSKKENNVSVQFSVNNRAELLEKIEATEPEILVVDIVMPDVNGLDLFTELVKKHPHIKLIAYSTLKSSILVENLLSIGVMGYVNKNQDPEDLLTAIKSVYHDRISVPEKYKFLTSRFHLPEPSMLTKREMEILLLIAAEETTQQIANKLGVSPKTIENHKIVLFKKLDVKNAAGLVLAATRLGYIS